MAKKLSREKAIELLHTHMKNINLRRHCYAVEAAMRSLAERFDEDPETWGIAGLLHDVDYEKTKDSAKKDHTKLALKWLEVLDAESDIKDAVASHAWQFVDGAPVPVTKMQWALYCCDELTGFIIAVALVKEEKKLSAVTVESVLRKWNSKAFARGVNRKQIESCETRLGIPLPEFIEITLNSMQQISDDLGL